MAAWRAADNSAKLLQAKCSPRLDAKYVCRSQVCRSLRGGAVTIFCCSTRSVDSAKYKKQVKKVSEGSTRHLDTLPMLMRNKNKVYFYLLKPHCKAFTKPLLQCWVALMGIDSITWYWTCNVKLSWCRVRTSWVGSWYWIGIYYI